MPSLRTLLSKPETNSCIATQPNRNHDPRPLWLFKNIQNDEYWTFLRCAIQQRLILARQITRPPPDIHRPIRASGCRRQPPPSVIDSCRLLRRRLPNEAFAYKSNSPPRHGKQSSQAFSTRHLLGRRRCASTYQLRTPEHTCVLPSADRFYFRLTEYWTGRTYFLFRRFDQ